MIHDARYFTNANGGLNKEIRVIHTVDEASSSKAWSIGADEFQGPGLSSELCCGCCGIEINKGTRTTGPLRTGGCSLLWTHVASGFIAETTGDMLPG